jgi:hypothetical protein
MTTWSRMLYCTSDRVHNERGTVLLIVIIIIVCLTLIGIAANRNIITDLGIATNHTGSLQAFYAAEACAALGYQQLSLNLKAGVASAMNLSPPVMPGYSFEVTSVKLGESYPRIGIGDFSGLLPYVQKYCIEATAHEERTKARADIRIIAEEYIIPVFQYAVFYNRDLEIDSQNGMMTGSGRIHSNGDLYLSPGSDGMQISGRLTVAGNIHHHRKPGDQQPDVQGPVTILGADTNYYRLTYGSDDQVNWPAEVTQWGSNVKTVREGVVEQAVWPVGSDKDDNYILDRAGIGTMGEKAGVIIVGSASDIAAYDRAGNRLSTCFSDPAYKDIGGNSLKDPGCTDEENRNSVTYKTGGSFLDYREVRRVNSYDINLKGLQSSQAGTYLNDPVRGGEAGLLYVWSSNSESVGDSSVTAVRVTDAATLNNAITIATDRPVYVQGDFNKNTPKSCAIISDALTVLSNSWQDSYDVGTALASRRASDTVVNAAIMTGNTETTDSAYGGGLRGLVRYLEDWSEAAFMLQGSLVCNWKSEKVIAPWRLNTANDYHRPPVQSLRWNSGAMPPGTPAVHLIRKTIWRQL